MELGRPDLSIILPAIRVNRWKTFLDSIDLSRYSYEVIFASPFDPPKELKEHHKNIHFLKTYDTPSVCTQKALLAAKGEYVWSTVDDCKLLKGAIDESMDFVYNNMDEKDVLNARYTEGAGFSGHELPLSFWLAHSHSDLRLAGIQPYWKISLQPIINREYLLDIGGLDCIWEYSNFGFHDLIFRIQRDGGKIYDSPSTMTSADHYMGTSGDHKPIHNAQIYHDQPIFTEMYSKENYRIKIPLDNYRKYEGIWMKRYRKQYQSYEEMAREEGYSI